MRKLAVCLALGLAAIAGTAVPAGAHPKPTPRFWQAK